MTVPDADSSAKSPAPTLLVVEDNSILRILIQRALGNEGYHVLTAPDGRAAKRMINETPVHLVVTDVYMSDGDGVDLVMHLHETRPHLPVIVMSAGFRGMESSLLRATQLLGACRTLEKPFSLQALLDAVRGVLGPATPPA